MQALMSMGDSRHKNPPPAGKQDEVTNDFIADVRSRLTTNRRLNKISTRPKDDPRRLIDSHAMLAQALSDLLGRDVSEKQISNIIGPVRPGSKWDKVSRSAFVEPIRKVLELETMTSIQVPTSRVTILHWLARVPREKFADLEAALEDARRADIAK